MRTWAGTIVLGQTVTAHGGSSSVTPGPGGELEALCDVSAKQLTLRGTVAVRGGTAGGTTAGAPGGRGGRIELRAMGQAGPVAFEAAALVDLGGGGSAGPGTAGDGGEFLLVTSDASVTLAGTISAAGGNAPGAGGTGGRGGFVWFRCDENADGLGGNITIESSGVIDASGGSGTSGGSARNNGAFGVGFFPNHQGKLAVILDADSAPGRLTDGFIDNRGRVVARGGAQNGWGGDVIFHGGGTGPGDDPLPGTVDLAGHGTGQPGDFASQ
jgi:hypothetical protein